MCCARCVLWMRNHEIKNEIANCEEFTRSFMMGERERNAILELGVDVISNILRNSPTLSKKDEKEILLKELKAQHNWVSCGNSRSRLVWNFMLREVMLQCEWSSSLVNKNARIKLGEASMLTATKLIDTRELNIYFRVDKFFTIMMSHDDEGWLRRAEFNSVGHSIHVD